MLRFADLPGWLRTTLGVVYGAWALAVTAFGGFVVIRSLGFSAGPEPTTETIVLLAGLLVAPLMPFAERLLFPGGGGLDFNVERTSAVSRAAKAGIEQAAVSVKLPPLNFASGEEGADD